MGIVYRNENEEIEIKNVSDGAYCAGGNEYKYSIVKGSCDKLKGAEVKVNINKITSNSITVATEATDELGIKGIYYSLNDKDYKVGENVYTFHKLELNKVYTIYVKVVNSSNIETIVKIEATTLNINNPTYAIDKSDWAQSKKVTINYPSGEGLTYEYSIDKGTSWNTATKTQEVTFTSNGSIIARVLDGTNTVTANTFTVDKIDTTVPVISEVSGNTDSWTKDKTLTVTAADEGGSEIAGYSFDDGSTWQTGNSKKITTNGTYNIKVKDNAGNVSAVSTVEVTKIDTQTPTITVAKSTVGSNYIVVTSTVTNNPMGISKMEYSIDNGSTWIADGTSATHTFTGLTKNKSYTIKARITSNNGKTATSTAITVSTSDITVPTYAIDNSGWAQSKKVTITYPSISGQTLTYEYSIDKGTSWKTATKTQEVTFTSNGSIIARVKDGTNTVTANTFTVDKIDTTVPVISSVEGNTTTWTTNKTLTVNATDEGGSEIAGYSFDNGSTWQTSNSKKITANGTYNIKVKDNAGNISAATSVVVSKIDTQTPTITVAKTSVGSSYIVVTSTVSNNPMGISKMEYSIDNGSTWTEDGVNTTHTFAALTKNNSYTIKARVTSKNGKVGTSASLTVSTVDIATPTYSIDNSGWAKSKKVTITFPSISGETLRYKYSIDKGVTWKTATKTQEVTFTSNGSIIASVTDDGANTTTANTFTVDKIDTTVPTISSVGGNTDIWTKDKTLTVTASDDASGVKEYSFDNGSTWQTGNSKKITTNGTYNIKVKDNAGNISAVTSVVISKIDNNTPTITIDGISTGSNYISVLATVSNNPMGISKMEYSIDNGSTWTEDGVSTTHIFRFLEKNTAYTIKVRVTSNNGKTATSNSVTATTKDLSTPTYAIDNSGWAQSKKVTITYPSISGQVLTYDYSLDRGTTWIDATQWFDKNAEDPYWNNTNKTLEIPFTANGSIIARVKDGTNIVTANTFTVDKIETTKPVISSVSGNTERWTAFKALIVVATDEGGSGIAGYSFDNGSTWQNYNSKSIMVNGTYNIRVKDNAGNISDAYPITIINVDPTITNPNPPTLLNNALTPVRYNGSNWVVAKSYCCDPYYMASSSSNWYDYANQEWANAVILNSGITKNVGDTVDISSETKAMFVWIPRYEYKITGTYGKGGTLSGITNDSTNAWTSVDGGYKSSTQSKNSTDTSLTYKFTMNTRADISFDWSVSSESCCDYLYYTIKKSGTAMSDTGTSTKIGGTTYGTADDSMKYTTVNKTLDAGTYELTFTYHKDGSVNTGTDTGYVKNVYIPGSSASSPGEVEVNFIPKSQTTATSGYRIHPAFNFGGTQLEGIWVGKFETSHTTLSSSTTNNNLGCSSESCSNEDGLRILPNKTSLRYNNVVNFFYASRSMTRSGNGFGLSSSYVDSHMMKNSEWGAVAYLSQSKYGKYRNNMYAGFNKEIYQNKSSSYTTGMSNGAPSSSTTNTQCTYNTLINRGNGTGSCGGGASTTGNITGIYDMNGGGFEYVMGVLADSSGNPRSGESSNANSGFTGSLSSGSYTGISFPAVKYYDKYTSTNSSSNSGSLSATACSNGVCYGHALSETMSWYKDYYTFVISSRPWFVRGGYWESSPQGSGIFYFANINGSGYETYSSRTVLTPK